MTSIDPFAPVELQHPGAGLSLHILPYGLIPHRLLLNVRQDGPLHPSSGIEGGGSATHDLLTGPEEPKHHQNGPLHPSSGIEGGGSATHDLLTGPEEPKHHQSYGRSFFGPVIGRYANRLPAGNQKYGHGQEMLVPVWGGENLCLHGGPASGPNGGPPVSLPSISQDDVPLQEGPLDTMVWTPLSNVSKAELFKDQDLSDPVNGSKAPQGSARVFAINHRPSSDGSGPPVTLRIEALIAVQAGSSGDVPSLGISAGKVRIEYRAEQRRSGKEEAVPTPLNLTHHWAFNLSASDPSARQTEKGTIEQHELRMLVRDKEEEQTLELDSRSVPLGQLKAADGERKGSTGRP
ncbi:ALDOSE-1-EPIMERASE [Ceraceosorus bombacis]|uniref:ALDOSE-1-EPIMERASE n=1 Tax=Ceraceosorus bombacis TaxID=401625 RepID=A0A0P1BSI3_9BASI|nr:ALDOSE-1-EPIMERASE [Ceraceosorus bombacis]